MNTHYCKVGTVRPKMNTILNSTELENKSVKQETEKAINSDKLSK